MRQMITRFVIGLALFIGALAGQAAAQIQQVKGIGWAASTTVAPALATDGNNAYIAWVDSATSDVYYATWGASGSGWYNPKTVSGTNLSGGTWTAQSDAAPAWGYDGSFFYLFWKGKGGNKIWFSSLTSGGDWNIQSVVKGSGGWTAETNVAPAATFTGWPVTLYWLGMSGESIWTSSLDDLAPGWTTQQVVKGWTTNVAPCVESSANSSDTPAVFLKDATDNGIAGFVTSKDTVSGSGWAAETIQPPAAVLDVSGQDLVMWTGQSGTSIWYSYNTGTPIGLGGVPKWSKQATVTGAKTYLAPAVAQANGSSGFISLLAWKNASDDTLWYWAYPVLP